MMELCAYAHRLCEMLISHRVQEQRNLPINLLAATRRRRQSLLT